MVLLGMSVPVGLLGLTTTIGRRTDEGRSKLATELQSDFQEEFRRSTHVPYRNLAVDGGKQQWVLTEDVSNTKARHAESL